MNVAWEGGDHKNMEKNTKIKPSCEYLCEFEENPSISMSSKILVKIHAVLRKLPYCPCALLPMCPLSQGPPSVSAVLTKIPFTNVPHCPCAPLAMCHIAHVSKRCQVVKKMSSCQKYVKCQKVKHIDHGHNEVHTY